MSSQSDMIREPIFALLGTAAVLLHDQKPVDEARAAFHALLAENRRQRDELEGWLQFVLDVVADPEASAHIEAAKGLARLRGEQA